jgi:putative colanic acid biosynthesis acetyltransferase WcaF
MSDTGLDIASNRGAAKYSKSVLLKRLLWGMAQPLFRFSPRIFFGWRRFLLRLFGARVGRHVHVYNSAVVYMPWNLEIGDSSSIGEHAFIYNLGVITIGRNATVSQRAHLCAGSHDYRKIDMPLLKPPIHVGDQVWVCADAFIGPNVTIGEGAIVGARGVAVKDVGAWEIVAGNPARLIGRRTLESPVSASSFGDSAKG